MISISRRGSFSLIELLISFVLFSVLLLSLSWMFWGYLRYDTEIENRIEQAAIFQANTSRLQRILSNVHFENANKHIFYSAEGESSLEKGESLIFTYDAGVELPPVFSNINIGKLYLDQDNKLMLASWPSREQYKGDTPPMRQEVLFEDVTLCSLKFFSAREPVTTPTSKGIEKGVWVSSWSKDYNSCPTLIEVHLTFKESVGAKNQNELIFCCYLPREFPMIFYP